MQWFFVLALITISSPALAKITILGVDNPPLLFKTTDGVNGMSGKFGEMVAGAIKKAHKESDFEVVWIPQKRALAELDRNTSGIFMPFTRTPDRENKYHWILHLGDYDSLIYSLDPKTKIESLQDLKKFKIGVLAGSIRERELRKILGPHVHIEAMTEDRMNYRMLKSGRIDLWIAQQAVVEEAQKRDGATTGKKTPLYIVKKMMTHSFWLAGNLALAQKDLKNLRQIFGVPPKFHQTDPQSLSARTDDFENHDLLLEQIDVRGQSDITSIATNVFRRKLHTWK